MCGLAAVVSKRGKHAGQRIIQLYQAQKTRGKDGFGYLAITKGYLTGIHRSRSEIGITSMLNKEKADTILFHHRFPTSTKNTIGTTHPILVDNPELPFIYYVAHNGVISNDDHLKILHEAAGYKYTTEFKEKKIAEYNDGTVEVLESDKTVYNDSEAFAIELALHLNGIQERVRSHGPIAFWAAEVERGTNKVNAIYFGKNKGRDLCYSDKNKWRIISSETGGGLEEMKIFSFNPSDESLQLYEQDFPVAEAAPVVVVTPTPQQRSMGFHRFDDDDGYRYSHGFSPSNLMEKFIYDKLPNNYFTLLQVRDIGLPDAAFSDAIHERVRMWLPAKYIGVGFSTREPITGDEFDALINSISFMRGNLTNLISPEKKEDKDEKAEEMIDEMVEGSIKSMIQLQDLAMDFVEYESKIEDLDYQYNSSMIDKEEYQSEIDRIELEMQQIDNKMSALGYDVEVIDAIVEQARELYDIQKTTETRADYEVEPEEAHLQLS